MKVLFDARIHLNYYSGISRYIICLLESYLRLFPDDEVIVLLNPTIQKDNSIYARLSNYHNVRFDVIDLPHMGPRNYLSMGRIVKKYKPDVYHYPHLDAPVYTGKVPVVATIHDTNSGKNVQKFDDRFGLKSMYFRQALKLTMKRASQVIFVSESIQREVEHDFHAEKFRFKFHRIYNGMERDFGQIDAVQATQLLENLDIKQNYLLYVGQIREHKNIPRMLQAFQKIRLHNKDIHFVLVGHNYLRQKPAGEGIIHLDKVSNSELKALYFGCKGFVFPSLFEGFGFPILEAFSFGKRVLTTHYGATAEISGNLAILIDPLSVEEISSGMQTLLTEDNLELQRKAHVGLFSWDDTARQVRSVYLKALVQSKQA